MKVDEVTVSNSRPLASASHALIPAPVGSVRDCD